MGDVVIEQNFLMSQSRFWRQAETYKGTYAAAVLSLACTVYLEALSLIT